MGRYRNKVSLNDSTFIRVPFQVKTNLLQPDNNIFVLNATEQFTKERNESDCYRFNGKLEIITDNLLNGPWGNIATTNDWSPEITDNNYVGLNWVLQLTYPSTSDHEFIIKTRDISGGINETKASEGLQIKSVTPIEIKNGKTQILLRTVQKHGIENIDEYVYIKPLQGELSYLGFHKVSSFEPDNEDYGLILETEYISNTLGSFKGNVKRVFEPSFNDVLFSEPENVTQIQTCDENGQNIGPLEYTKIYSNNHGLFIGDFVDIRLSNFSVLNGLWKVTNVINDNQFIVKCEIPGGNGGIIDLTTLTSSNGPVTLNYKFIDGVPSEYYVRKFKVLTELKDYEVYKAGFSKNIFVDGYNNEVHQFHFNKDIKVSNLRDNLNRPLSELYLTIFRRASSGHPDYEYSGFFSNVISMFEDNKMIQPNPIGTGFDNFTIETISYWQNTTPETSGSISKPNIGDEYYGDFVEYNRAFLNETIISKVIHRFTPSIWYGTPTNGFYTTDYDGYYYYPHNKITIREFSDVIQTQKRKTDVEYPDYAQINNDGTISWRNILDIGSFEPGTNKGVDHTFINGCNYLFGLYPIYIRRQLPVNLDDKNVNKTYFVKASNKVGLIC